MPLIVIFPREAQHECKYCFTREFPKLARYEIHDGICIAAPDGSVPNGLELIVQHRRFVIGPSGRQVLAQVECCLHSQYYSPIHESHELEQATVLVSRYGFKPVVPKAAHPEMSG